MAKQKPWHSLIQAITSALLLTALVGLAAAQSPETPLKAVEQPQVSIDGLMPSAISYQGLLRENGQPVTGNRDMVFSLYTDSDCSGTAEQSITKNNVPADKGLFSVSLDVNFAHFNGQGLWLKVRVGSSNLGCEEILPVPYALSLRPDADVFGEVQGKSVIFARNTDTTHLSSGLHGWTDSSYDGAKGAWGTAAATSGETMGVYGEALSPAGYGGYFENHAGGTGVYAKSGGGYGVHAYSETGTALAAEAPGGTAIQAIGDVQQTLAGDGLVKAAALIDCGNSGSTIHRYFNNLEGSGGGMAIRNGPGAGACSVNFNTNVSTRFIVATPTMTGSNAQDLGVVVRNPSSTVVEFFRFDTSSGNGSNGDISVLIY